MAGRPKITITMVGKKGNGACHYGHKIGDRFDFDQDPGENVPDDAAYRFSVYRHFTIWRDGSGRGQ